MTQKLRVWHIPQVPGKPFHVEVSSVEEGVKVMDVLANYDLFQLENNIKGDFCNMNGLELYDENLTDEDLEDMGLDDRWCDWSVEVDGGEEFYEFFEDPREYLEWKESQND